MEWACPQAPYFILPVCIGWVALSLYARSRRRRAAENFVAARMHARILPRDSAPRFWIKTLLTMLGFGCALLAVAQPRWGSYYEEVRVRGVDVYVLIDVSKSMLAKDVTPSRLERAKADVRSLLNRLQGNRVGLIAFAGKTSLKCPLTTDHDFYRMSLNDLDTTSAPRGGTAIGDAIRKALEYMPREAGRDKVILLFTDGDDQNSYPEDAARQAAEKGVNIYCVGLGDPAQAALLEQTDSSGKRVESQLNERVLTSIASITGGGYFRTGYYDVDDLYSQYLAKRTTEDAIARQRVRLHERYQIFLGCAIFLLLLELCIRPHSQAADAGVFTWAGAGLGEKSASSIFFAAALFTGFFADNVRAAEPSELVREGLELYARDEFDAAREKFTSAEELLRGDRAEQAAITAFNLACVSHRKGDAEQAQAQYLRAAQTRDARLSAAAHFNIGCLISEGARGSAGDDPLKMDGSKRGEIVDKLKTALKSFRNCLNIEPGHVGARKNIELIRQWIKYHNEKWREKDRKKLRDETDLLQFLDYITGSERVLRSSVRSLGPKTSYDVFAEHKRAQDELAGEIEPLKEKIRDAVRAAQPKPAPGVPPADTKKVEDDIAMLQKFADNAAANMRDASAKIAARDGASAVQRQRLAILELEKLADAVSPLDALLDRALKGQTFVAGALEKGRDLQSPPQADSARGVDDFKKLFALSGGEDADPKAAASPKNAAAPKPLMPELCADFADIEDKVARQSTLMPRRAREQMSQLEQQASAPPSPSPDTAHPAQPDPKKMKEWLEKVCDLAPKAAEKVVAAAKLLRGTEPVSAYADAEAGRKLLEEIANSRPRDPNQKPEDKDKEKDKQKDQKKQDEQKKQDQKQDDKDKKDKQDQKKEDQDKKKQDEKDKKDAQEQQKKEEQDKKDKAQQSGAEDAKDGKEMSKDEAEALLRKIREHEQARKDKQKAVRAQGTLEPVEKDY
jgi:Ca-activated chloride channel family protein